MSSFSDVPESLFGAGDLIIPSLDKHGAETYLRDYEDTTQILNVQLDQDLTQIEGDEHQAAIPPDLTDLSRLHVLARSRRALTVLEFGIGYSTLVLAHALSMNEKTHRGFMTKLRKANLFEVHCVDDSEEWIEHAVHRIPLTIRRRVIPSFSRVAMSTFNGRICTEYEQLPNISPDFIYLDGPSQDLVKGDIRGISTRHSDRLPMACDILKIEHFLLPGTLIVIDGRTANARFLLSNLQRGWWHHHDREGDVHYLELREQPLGRWNEAQLDFCLGDSWRTRFGV